MSVVPSSCLSASTCMRHVMHGCFFTLISLSIIAGQSSLTAMNPNIKVVDTPRDELLSAISVSSLFPYSRGTTALSTESLPTSSTCIPEQPPSFSSPSVLGIPSRTVQVEGVDETCDKKDLELAFDNEDKGGGAIEEHGIVLKGSTAYITFKDPTGENMKTMAI